MLSLRPSRSTLRSQLQIKAPARSFPSSSRNVVRHGVVPVAERNGWWLKRPQPNMIESKGLASLWCASCKGLYPKLSNLCAENPQILVVKINFEENRELAKKLGVKVLPFFHAYHGSMGRVAAFSSSVTKVQRLKDCIELFGNTYCDIEAHKGNVDVFKSLPEFAFLATPKDATVLQFSSDGEYDASASIAAKEAQAKEAAEKAVKKAVEGKPREAQPV